MYNIVIAEDNKAIREGLKSFFENKIPGYTVLECFSDGKETIEYISQNYSRVDVVLTDIKMTNQTGLDVARFIKENSYDIVVVVLSAYQEFDFAREAISANVYGYLLKPVRFDKLKEIFDEIKEKLDKKNESTTLGNINESKVEKLVLKVESVHNDEQLNKSMHALQITQKLKNMPYCLLEIIMEHSLGESAERIIGAVNDILQSMSLSGRLLFNMEESVIMVITAEVVDSEQEGELAQLNSDSADNHDLVIKKALSYIEENFRKDIYLADVAKYVYLSPMYFGRIFKEKTGVSFTDYLIEKRMNLACVLLKEGKTVQDTSFSVGYSNTQYFIRLFKKNIGMSPGVYKRLGDEESEKSV